jgi:hypothetical protein
MYRPSLQSGKVASVSCKVRCDFAMPLPPKYSSFAKSLATCAFKAVTFSLPYIAHLFANLSILNLVRSGQHLPTAASIFLQLFFSLTLYYFDSRFTFPFLNSKCSHSPTDTTLAFCLHSLVGVFFCVFNFFPLSSAAVLQAS